MKRACVLALLAAACGQPSSVRVRIALAADAEAYAAGPALLSLYTPLGRVLNGRSVPGQLPGDVLVLVANGSGEARALVRVVSGSGVAEGVGEAPLVDDRVAVIDLTLSTTLLPDTDGDGVPDQIDDCPTVPDPLQVGDCGDDGGVDAGPIDAAVDLSVKKGCGDGVVQMDEACDNGPGNSDDPASMATCTTSCKVRAPCGTVAAASSALVDPMTGHCYVAWPNPLPWANAERDCLSRGGHLAEVTSAAENTLVNKLDVAAASWIGVTSFTSGTTSWSDGETSAYDGFSAASPATTGNSCVVIVPAGGPWQDQACGFPATGLLPASPTSTASYVCENSCGNGVVEPGEECDPPAVGTCTSVCRKTRACTEPGGMVSPATGYCYFATATAVAYAAALASSCPTGTHLATPNGLMESETVDGTLASDSWIAVHAPTTAGVFVYDQTTPTLDLPRYHGFVAPDPDMTTVPACGAFAHTAASADGWRDRACTNTYPAVCERD
jgi:hypothetical protein